MVVLAFSLDGVPAPLVPAGTLEFDAAGAAKSTRDVLALGDTRKPGSPEDDAVADLVAERFSSVVAGTVGEQSVEASVDGEDVELRNVLLTLPGDSDHAIVVLAGRDSREGEGAPSSAAATGVLLELVDGLSARADPNRTLILASTSGASAEGQGARELVAGLPDRTIIDGVVVISQPGYSEPFEPHVVTSGAGSAPPAGLARTAEDVLRERAMLSPGRPGPLEQIARYGIPAAAGEQAGLIADGLDAIALSSAGELPLPASETDREHLETATLERFGPTLLALVSALDAAPRPPSGGPGDYLWVGDNLVPGWSVGLLVISLLVPPAALAASLLGRARTRGTSLGRAMGWAFEWWLPALVACLAIYALSLVGVIPASGVPYDPARFELGAAEAVVLVLVAALAAWLWWVLRLRRPPASLKPAAIGGAAGVAAVTACVLVWIANPYLALVLLPLVHVIAVFGADDRRPAKLAIPVLLIAALPLAASLVYVSSVLDWGASAPWQLAVLIAGGGIPPIQALGAAFALASVAAIALSAFATAGSPRTPART